jgi:hypothetical protein
VNLCVTVVYFVTTVDNGGLDDLFVLDIIVVVRILASGRGRSIVVLLDRRTAPFGGMDETETRFPQTLFIV